MSVNVRRAAIAYLRGIGMEAYASVPADRPERFCTVQLTGGSAGEGIARRTVSVDCWAGSDLEADTDAQAVWDALKDMERREGIRLVERQSIQNLSQFADGARGMCRVVASVTAQDI